MSRLRYYISGHGLGHASRSCQIINTLRRRHPRLAVEVVSDAQEWFLRDFLDPSVPVRRCGSDIGVLQGDSLEMRERETFEVCRKMLSAQESLVEAEAASLSASGVTLVVCDVPAAPIEAAWRAGVPAVALSNFSWDWIYEGMLERHPGFEDVVEGLRRQYRRASLLLRLPFHGDLPAFSCCEDLPLVARCSTLSGSEVRKRLSLPEGVRVGLVSFGGFGLRGADLRPLEALSGWIFLTEGNLGDGVSNVRRISAGTIPYPDLVAASDAVITKPGYGIVSECIAAGTPMLYTSRGDFREQALLVEGIRRYGRARLIGNGELRAGRWGEELEALLDVPLPPERIALDGDEVAADRLAEMAGTASEEC